jgi:hypothetical protein
MRAEKKLGGLVLVLGMRTAEIGAGTLIEITDMKGLEGKGENMYSTS